PSPSTTPSDPGTPPAAPSASTGAAGTWAYAYGYTPCCMTAPGRASCACRSQCASLLACQIPLKLGLPSAVRAAGGDAWPALRVTDTEITAVTAAAASTTTIIEPVDQRRMTISPSYSVPLPRLGS